MRAGHWEVFVFLAVILASADTANDCIYQKCFCEGNIVYCNSLGLTSIPPLSPPGDVPISDLQFDDNNITAILPGSLPAGLTRLTITNNPIQTIDDMAFTDVATTLQMLGLTLAPSSRIPDALMHLESLNFLDIINTDIVDWNENVMKYLAPKLNTLTLSSVSFHTWPDWIQYCKQVSELALVYSYLQSIPDNGLDSMATTVISMSLTGNNLTAVPKAISNFTNMTVFAVDKNKIRDVTWLPKQCRMDTLDVSNNKIFNATQLSEALRPYAEFLVELDIDHNELTEIPDLQFLTMDNFDFSFNNIYDLTAGSLPSKVSWLNLNNNLLSSLPRMVLSLQLLSTLLMESNLVTSLQASTIPSTLQYLSLQNNLVTELTDASFPENSSLLSLYLDNNPLTKISDLAFANLAKLRELHLSSTRLTRLPLGLPSLHSITLLDVSDITGLVCTCLEKDLGPWIKSLASEIVFGNCGVIKVYDFFALLSPGCPR
ncbi:unnamed protein product [Candidula unifasciata]|uniref:Uncharacterized protein n=1 Tax=Candidula unifasciata TaxID=100452 RepID=A0A8S3ZEK3_9EUPU|nr:unnamed protein product [Candidula unifasciata]